MRSWTTGIVIVFGSMMFQRTVMAQPSMGDSRIEAESHLRSNAAALVALMRLAVGQSRTFRRMVETINASDGIVYVVPGGCPHGGRACLVNVTSAGTTRLIFVKVDTRRSDGELMASIGHELRHTIEVLSDPEVTDYATLRLFYKDKRRGLGAPTAFETQEAIEAGDAVAAEIRRSTASPRKP